MLTTIAGLQDHFAKLYGPRNSFVNGSFESRCAHMFRRIGRLADAKRKSDRMAARLASAVSYFMGVVNYYGGAVSLQRGMMRKLPLSGCAYCGYKPCQCLEAKRPEPKMGQMFDVQAQWLLSDWQNHLKSVYGHHHGEDFWKVYGRLCSELGELAILNVHGPNTPVSLSEIIEACELEAADVFAWIVTLAYIQGIDLQTEVIARYQVCPVCRQFPCACPLITVSADGQSFSMAGTSSQLV
jgi:NTP pyrophosphatase (non-canonical NTP hydrolase)